MSELTQEEVRRKCAEWTEWSGSPFLDDTDAGLAEAVREKFMQQTHDFDPEAIWLDLGWMRLSKPPIEFMRAVVEMLKL